MADILNDTPTTFAADPQIVDQPDGDAVLGIHANEFRTQLKALNRVYRAAEGPRGFNQISVMEFGAVGDGITDNLLAFENAAAALSAVGGGQLLIPPTDLGFRIEGTLEVPPGVILKGFGLRGAAGPQSLLRSRIERDSAAIRFSSGDHRGGIEDLRIAGASENHPAGIGIDCTGTQYLKFKRFRLHHFEVGLQLSDGITPFTAYTSAEDFEIHHCRIGVRALRHTNACAIKDGRIFWSFDDGDGVALDIADVEVLAVENVQLESMDTGMRVRGLVKLALRDVYFETGDPTRVFTDIVAAPGSTLRMENVQANASNSAGISASLEDAVVMDVHGEPSFGALRHYASAAGRNLVENGDFHRADGIANIPRWAAHNGPILAEENADVVTAGRAYRVTRNGNANDGLTTSFVVSEHTDFTTVMVRFKNISSRSVLFSAVCGGQSAQWADPRPADASDWRLAAWTVPMDPAANGLITLYLTADQLADGGSIIIDEAWAVVGRTAAPPSAHAHRVELLPEPFTVVSRVAAINEVFPAVDLRAVPNLGGAPRGLAGAVLRLRGMTNSPMLGQIRGTVVNPYVDVAGAPPIRLDIVADQVMFDKEFTLRGTNLSGGLTFPAGVGVQTQYFVDVVGWVV